MGTNMFDVGLNWQLLANLSQQAPNGSAGPVDRDEGADSDGFGDTRSRGGARPTRSNKSQSQSGADYAVRHQVRCLPLGRHKELLLSLAWSCHAHGPPDPWPDMSHPPDFCLPSMHCRQQSRDEGLGSMNGACRPAVWSCNHLSGSWALARTVL